jgi:thioredoxin 1
MNLINNQTMKIINVTNENFVELVLENENPVLVDFWADWCGPCRAMEPVLDKIAEDNPNLQIAKVNIDQQQELAVRYQVMSIPMMLVFVDGKIVEQFIGMAPANKLQATLDAVLD